MNILFDTSVLVPALVDQLPNHPVCFSAFVGRTGGEDSVFCSTHSIAECFSVLTSLPLTRRISPAEARQLVLESILSRVTVVPLDREDYRWALDAVSGNGLSGGIVYDALHLRAARKSGCVRVFTYNTNHFTALRVPEIEITTP